MELCELSIQNYKAFPRREVLSVKPLTVLIGRNSAGKSALVRLPLLLRNSLSAATQSPLDLEVDGVDFGASFVDLIHNRSPHGAIILGAAFENAGQRSSFIVQIQHYDEFMMQVIARLDLQTPQQKVSLIRESSPDDESARL